MRALNLSLAIAGLCLACFPAFSQDAGPRATQSISNDQNQSNIENLQLEKDVLQLRYEDLEHDLSTAEPGPAADLFTGILDNRTGHLDKSIALLESALPYTQKTMPRCMGMALLSLGDDYLKTFRYADADRAYRQLLVYYADQLDPGERQDAIDDEATIHLLIDAPPQTIRWNGPVDIPTHKSPLGSFDAELTVNGVTGPWILDTGANFSVLSESYAKKLGVASSAGAAQTKGLTGAENKLHTGLLRELHIGGATLNNVVVLILPDKNLEIATGPKTKYPIDAILGFPVFQAFGQIGFTQSGKFLAGSSVTVAGQSSRMFMDKLNPLLECGVHGKQRLFQFDTGANNTQFFVPYYREFADDIATAKHGRIVAGGAGGVLKQKVYVLNDSKLEVAGKEISLHNIPVFSKPLGTTGDDTYGNLGRDLVAGFDSFTLDFADLRFHLGQPSPVSAKQDR